MSNGKQRILIVDDAQVICDLLQTDLNERGYECTAALNGLEALRALGTHRFDVVLLDTRLPEMSGIEVLRKISLLYPDVAVIMTTAINDTCTASEVMGLGALDYIVKPFDLDKLGVRIQHALQMKSTAHKHSIAADAIQTPAISRIEEGYTE